MSRCRFFDLVALASLMMSAAGTGRNSGDEPEWKHNSDFKILTQVFDLDQGIGTDRLAQRALDGERWKDSAPDQGDRPASTNVTLFTESTVYDLRFENEHSQPSEIAILDVRNRNFTLLDTRRQFKSKLENLQLLKFVEGMRNELIADERTRFLAADDYSETFDPDTGLITLSAPQIRYSVAGRRPADDTVLTRYFDFLEHYTLLAASNPNQVPPFPRMVLNRQIKKFGYIPSEVNLEIRSADFSRFNRRVKSVHQFVPGLDQYDLRQIDSAREQWARFQDVDLLQYRQIQVTEQTTQSGNVSHSKR